MENTEPLTVDSEFPGVLPFRWNFSDCFLTQFLSREVENFKDQRFQLRRTVGIQRKLIWWCLMSSDTLAISSMQVDCWWKLPLEQLLWQPQVPWKHLCLGSAVDTAFCTGFFGCSFPSSGGWCFQTLQYGYSENDVRPEYFGCSGLVDWYLVYQACCTLQHEFVVLRYFGYR